MYVLGFRGIDETCARSGRVEGATQGLARMVVRLSCCATPPLDWTKSPVPRLRDVLYVVPEYFLCTLSNLMLGRQHVLLHVHKLCVLARFMLRVCLR